MYGIMLTLFIASIVYYAFALLECVVLFFQVVTDNPYKIDKHFSWGHILLILINILVTIASAMYCFGGVR